MAIYLGEDSQSGECKEIVTSDEAYTNALLEFKADGTLPKNLFKTKVIIPLLIAMLWLLYSCEWGCCGTFYKRETA